MLGKIPDSVEIKLAQIPDADDKIQYILILADRELNKYNIDAIYFIDRAYDLANSSGKTDFLPEIYQLYGAYWKDFSDNYKSVQYLMKALKINENNKNKLGIARVYRDLGETYRAAQDFKKAHEVLFKAEKLLSEVPDTLLLASVYNRIAAVYFEEYTNESYKKSIEYAQKSIELSRKSDTQGLIVNNYNILGAAYRDLEKYEIAVDYFKKALLIVESESDEYNIHLLYDNLAETYLRMGKYELAIDYAKRSISISREKGIAFTRGFAHDIMAHAYKSIGKYKEALHHLYRSMYIKDSLFYLKKNQTISEIEAKYEHEKSRKELEQQKQIQQYQIIIFVVSLVFLFGLAVQFYFRHRALRSKNELISRQNSELEELNRTKDKFFSILAHDLKNPIGTYKNMAELLADNVDSFEEEERNELFELMKKSSRKLVELLENLLTWSRSQRGIIPYSPGEVDPRIIIEDTVNLLRLQAENKSINISMDIEEGLTVFADANMLTTILRNLISNAIKFTPNGGKIIVGLRDAVVSNEFFVSDTGMGMSPEIIGKLFRIDVNPSTLGTQKEKGTGLGLILCREFVEKHGGTIRVDSSKGAGSTFVFNIPKKK